MLLAGFFAVNQRQTGATTCLCVLAIFGIKSLVGEAVYRAVYAVRFRERIYVLHCFQKKSKKGKDPPRQDIELIKKRLKHAEKLEADEEKKRTKP